MRRLGSNLLVASLFALSSAACSSNTGGIGGGGSGSETETGDSTTGDNTSSVSMTSASTNNGTMGGSSSTTSTTMPNPTTGLDSSGGDSSTTGGTTTGGSSGGSGGDACQACVVSNCGDELNACLANPDCTCWLDCINAGNDPGACFGMCGAPPGEATDLGGCVDGQCDMECNGGGMTTGGSTGGSTGGMPLGGDYDECQDASECDMLECNGFINYCSIDCMGDDLACPIPATGDAVPECSGFSNNCILPCGGGVTCPDGMSCQNIGFNDLCAY